MVASTNTVQKISSEPQLIVLKKQIGTIKVDKSLFEDYIDSEYGYDALKLKGKLDFDLMHQGTNSQIIITKDEKGVINLFAADADISIGSGNNRKDKLKIHVKKSDIRLYSENNDDIDIGEYDKTSSIEIRYLNGPALKIGENKQ